MVILDDSNTVSITKIGADATKSGSVIGKFRITRTQFTGRPDVTVKFLVTGTAVLNTNYVQAGANFNSEIRMKVTFLGTGTSQGVPLIACQCRHFIVSRGLPLEGSFRRRDPRRGESSGWQGEGLADRGNRAGLGESDRNCWQG